MPPWCDFTFKKYLIFIINTTKDIQIKIYYYDLIILSLRVFFFLLHTYLVSFFSEGKKKSFFQYFVGCLSIDFRYVQTHFFYSINLNWFYSPSSAWGNLGNVLKNQGKVADAERAYRNALYYRRNMADMLYNL